jgi:hypothetical protein
MKDDEPAVEISVKWVADVLKISLDKADKVVENLYESEYFIEHIIEDLVEALEYVDE